MLDYYAFGMQMPGRTFNANSYRYGYNVGSEKDDEISGSGNNFTTEFREGDTRLGRWWSVDPEAIELPYQSPYCSMDNNPILNIDPDGDIVPIILGIWAVAEIAMSAYDAYETGKTLLDKNATKAQKVTAISGFTAGLFLPAGGYGTAGKQVVKQVEKKIVKETAKQVEKKVAKTVADPLSKRAPLRKSTKEAIKDAAPKTKDGRFIDPNTGKPIEKGQEVYGHKTGQEWSKYKKDPANQNKTRKEVLDDQNDPKIYQIEDRKSNASHKYEDKPKPKTRG